MSTIAITGINSYFAKTLLPGLEADPAVTRIVGLDVSPFEQNYSKVEFHRMDVRDPDVGRLFKNVDTLVHLAFIVQEIHNKKKTHSINIEGSKNVFRAAAANKVRKIVYTSSIASYGAHPDNPIGITEDYPLAANQDSYYSSDKAAVEKFLEGFAREHPGIILTIFRPPVIVGPRLNNFARDAYTRKRRYAIKGRDSQTQFLHEDDLGEALYLAVVKDLPGIFNIAADDYSTMRKISRIAGIKLTDLPVGLIKFLANVTFALRIEKVSQGWVSLMEWPIVISNEKFKKISGWQPRYGTEEAFRDFLKSRR